MIVSHPDISTESPKTKLLLAAAVFGVFAFTLISASWFFGNALALHAQYTDVAEVAVSLAPSDAQAHYTLAVLAGKVFSPEEDKRSLVEFERSVAASPSNYLLWLDLAKARENSGDATGAEKALKRAGELAPNYAFPKWALGNFYLRSDRTDEGIALVKTAVSADESLISSAISVLTQFTNGDSAKVEEILGSTEAVNVALADAYARQNKMDDALRVWKKVSTEAKQAKLRTNTLNLSAKLLTEKRFNDSLTVFGDISGDKKPSSNKIFDGGFEGEFLPDGENQFSWQLGAGLQPQIGFDSSVKAEGNRSLVLVFNSTKPEDFRTVSQNIAVTGGKSYSISGKYQSDVKTESKIFWEVFDPRSGAVIGRSQELKPSGEWSGFSIRFSVPAASDGVVLRLSRENCGAVCRISNKLFFDDIRLQ